MAVFGSLHEVGQFLKLFVVQQLSNPAIAATAVFYSPPTDVPEQASDRVRISLLWADKQAGHRSDVWETDDTGGRVPPPITLSVFFLVTTYGATQNGDAVDALTRLGQVMQLFHSEPQVMLPAPGIPVGEGPLGVTQVPMAPELMEKLFGPLQTKHRPFTLLEVAPVQLVNLQPGAAAPPMVLPGGLRVTGPEPVTRPLLERVIPQRQSLGGVLRLDGAFAAKPDVVWIGSTRVDAAAITELDPGRSVQLSLPYQVAEGQYSVSVVLGRGQSEAEVLTVVPAATPTLDPPPSTQHDASNDLVLAGRALLGALDVYAWPDKGIQSPAEVVVLPLSFASATSLTVLAADLAPLGARVYRFAARTAPAQFTPYVVLEVVP